MRLAVCNEIWGSLPAETVIQRAAEIGYEGLEIAPFVLAESVDQIGRDRRRELGRASADAGVQIVGLHWLFVSPPGLHLTTSDPGVRRRSSEYLRSLVDFCADIGGTVMTFGSPKQRQVEPPTNYAEAWQRAVEILAGSADACAARGVTVCIEALGPDDTNFINTAEEAAKMVDQIGHPNIGLMLDVKAMSAMPDGIIETIRKFGSRARHLHANDPSGRAPGMDGIDFAPVLEALHATGFEEWVSVEPFDYNPDPDTIAKVAFDAITRAMPA